MKPMLAARCDYMEDLRFPLYASIKFDGIRALVIDNVVVSRTLKPIPSRQVQKMFGKVEYSGCDGELIVGVPNDPDCYRKTNSHVMSVDKPADDLYFHVFDRYNYSNPWTVRYHSIPTSERVVKVQHTYIQTLEELMSYEEMIVSAGHEGIMVRDENARYKQGRSTMREQGLCKIKRFRDSEAVVVGVEERMHNANEATVDNLGHAKRSSHKANQIPTGTLGALVVTWEGHTFKIGTGFNELERQQLWQKDLTGRTVKFKYLPIGMKDAPRHPVFLGWRKD